jgi:hypothetical protein
MRKNYLFFSFLFFSLISFSRQNNSLPSFKMYNDVQVTLDIPSNYQAHKRTLLILYALPNGNSTLQTMGKKVESDGDWRFNIQHIKAQTQFIRNELKKENIVVAYLENNFKSWPTWKTKHPEYVSEIQYIVDTLHSLFPSKNTSICLNGHSGGGRFIFSYLDGVKAIPGYIERIVFLDSDYGYESSYGSQLQLWLHENKKAGLYIFAYNDNVALYQGKRIVSDTGGTWYRSHLMQKDLSAFFHFKIIADDSLTIYRSSNMQVAFYFKTNPEKKILHTAQVELNGFIHSILAGTKRESVNYQYYGKRAYESFIK